MEKSENLNQLLGLLSDSELRKYVLEYAEGNAEFKAFLLSHIRTDYVENETKDVDYKSEIEWIFSQTTDIGDRWHSYETADWCEIFECMDRVFHDADILLEQGNAEVPLAIAVQFFVSLDETCREHPEYDEEYDAEEAIEKAEHLMLECIGHPSVSEEARQEAFSVVKRLAGHNSIESYSLSMDSLLMEMSVKAASDGEALKLLNEMMNQKGANHRYVTWKVELLRKLGRSEEAEKTLRQHLYMPEIRMPEVDRAIDEKLFDDALSLAEGGYKAAKEHSVWGYFEWKWLEKELEVYKLQGNRQGEIDTLRRLFICHLGSMEYYHELKQLIPQDQWHEFLTKMLNETPFSPTFVSGNVKADIYVEEDDKEALFNLLSTLTFNRLDALCLYAHHLKDGHSDELIGMYMTDLREYAARKMGRDHYQRIANAMREMQKLVSGAESAHLLAEEFRHKFSNRRAMKEELKDF